VNRVFSIGNKAGTGAWIAAPTEAEALELAVKIGHVKAAKNARVKDITEKLQGQPGLDGIIKDPRSGRICKTGTLLTVAEVMAGKKGAPWRWTFPEDIRREG